MLRKDGQTEGWKTDGRTDGSVTISLRNFVGERLITSYNFMLATKKKERLLIYL